MDNLELLSRLKQLRTELNTKWAQKQNVLDPELVALSLEFDRLEAQYHQMIYPQKVKESI
ncbi:MAG: Spo0E family sporulation regulatory protein-aspartic acid phosphatase [Firmicutes bacterium]|nr:Spo0E family sporulation regulatory protein-aspartic acid phosphatase [Bacillota bacterium]